MKFCIIVLFLIQIIQAELLDLGYVFDEEIPVDLTSLKLRLSDNSKGLEEFTPIQNDITSSQLQLYSFSVNTSTGVGENYELLIFITGNICNEPSDLNDNLTSLAVYYSFNSSMFNNFEIGQMVIFENGYFEVLEEVPVLSKSENADSILYIAVRAPQILNTSEIWSYEIGVSQNDLVFQWDNRSWLSVVDTDANSALFITGNLTINSGVDLESINVNISQFSLFIYPYEYKDYFAKLQYSWCAIKKGPALNLQNNIHTNYTERGGGIHQQFYVSGLNSSTKYIAYLLSNFDGSDFGGVVYRPLEFETMLEGPCELIYDLEFCDSVAYSVPSNGNLSKKELITLYDDHVSDIYANFSKALQQIACDETDDAVYSTLSTCGDCASAYKSWLCSVSIPRCSTRNHTGYKERQVGESRSDFINEIIEPQFSYYEILPCVNVCQAIVRTCPADFNFMCPTHNESIKLSYYWDNYEDVPTCNYVGNAAVIKKSWAIRNLINWWLIAFCMLMIKMV